MVNHHDAPEEFLTTAWFCRKYSRWYDLVTSGSKKVAFSKNKLNKYREALAQLDEFCEIVQTMTFDCPAGEAERKPFKAWLLLTTSSIKELIFFFIETVGYEHLFCRKFSTEGQFKNKSFSNVLTKSGMYPQGRLVRPVVTSLQVISILS